MARSGKNLKKRGSRVSRKMKNPRVDKLTNKLIKEKWTAGKTLEQNYENLGLASDPNKVVEDTTTKKGALTAVLDKVDTAANLTSHGQSAARRKPYHMSEEEVLYLKPLVEKYGDDYTAMFRDTKLNYMQDTKNKLARRCKRYNLFTSAQQTS